MDSLAWVPQPSPAALCAAAVPAAYMQQASGLEDLEDGQVIAGGTPATLNAGETPAAHLLFGVEGDLRIDAGCTSRRRVASKRCRTQQ